LDSFKIYKTNAKQEKLNKLEVLYNFMITKEDAKEKIKQLVEEFSHYTKEELNNKSED